MFLMVRISRNWKKNLIYMIYMTIEKNSYTVNVYFLIFSLFYVDR